MGCPIFSNHQSSYPNKYCNQFLFKLKLGHWRYFLENHLDPDRSRVGSRLASPGYLKRPSSIYIEILLPNNNKWETLIFETFWPYSSFSWTSTFSLSNHKFRTKMSESDRFFFFWAETILVVLRLIASLRTSTSILWLGTALERTSSIHSTLTRRQAFRSLGGRIETAMKRTTWVTCDRRRTNPFQLVDN